MDCVVDHRSVYKQCTVVFHLSCRDLSGHCLDWRLTRDVCRGRVDTVSIECHHFPIPLYPWTPLITFDCVSLADVGRKASFALWKAAV